MGLLLLPASHYSQHGSVIYHAQIITRDHRLLAHMVATVITAWTRALLGSPSSARWINSASPLPINTFTRTQTNNKTCRLPQRQAETRAEVSRSWRVPQNNFKDTNSCTSEVWKDVRMILRKGKHSENAGLFKHSFTSDMYKSNCWIQLLNWVCLYLTQGWIKRIVHHPK